MYASSDKNNGRFGHAFLQLTRTMALFALRVICPILSATRLMRQLPSIIYCALVCASLMCDLLFIVDKL
jgi:hypothetical protein